MVPQVREFVHVEGDSGLFFVLAVDETLGCAYLMRLGETSQPPDWYGFRKIYREDDLVRPAEPETPWLRRHFASR